MSTQGIDLARYILPEEIFTYFTLVQVTEEGKNLHFYMEELNVLPDAYLGKELNCINPQTVPFFIFPDFFLIDCNFYIVGYFQKLVVTPLVDVLFGYRS